MCLCIISDVCSCECLCCVLCAQFQGGEWVARWRMNDRGVLVVSWASLMVLCRAGLVDAVWRYFRAMVLCRCFMVWMPVIVWM